MRELSSTLTTGQQAKTKAPLIRVVFTHGEDTYTYTKTRLADINHVEEPYSQTADIVLDNSDGSLFVVDLKGFQAVVSYGIVTSEGEEYSARAPLKVKAQGYSTIPGNSDCQLKLIGIPNQMADDHASAAYKPASDDVKTVKTLIGEIIGATMACFNHCEAFEIVWDSEDSLIDTYKPKDSFRVYVGGNRLSAVRRLLERTKCVMRVEADGKVHIFQPTTSGESYDYEYSLDSGHSFFSKAYRSTLVIPNYSVVQSQPDDDPQYSGYASDADSYALLPKRTYLQTRLESDAQATAIAEAIIAQQKLWSEMGSAEVAINVGAEVFDYVKVAAFNSDDESRSGNLGHLATHYNAARNEWRMTFSFGNWMNVRKALAGIDPTGSIGAEDIEAYFTRLMVKDLYAENIMAENIDMIWIDPDGNVDLSLIGDTLDSLPDGEVYARVKSLHIDAGGIKIDENILYSPSYDPTDKFDLVGNDFDDVPEGTVYQRAKSAALSAAGLVLLDEVVLGTYGLVKSAYISAGRIELWEAAGDLDDIDDGSVHGLVKLTDISAGHILLVEDQDMDDQGFKIYSNSGSTYIVIRSAGIRGYNADVLQFELDASDGKIKAGGGAVILDVDGITIKGEVFAIKSSGGLLRGEIYGSAYGLYLTAASGKNLSLGVNASYILDGIGFVGADRINMAACDYLDMPERTSHPTGRNGRRYHHSTENRNYQYVEGAWDIDS